jgi:hypothetical protein
MSEAVLAAADLRRLLDDRVKDMADGITAYKMEVWVARTTDPNMNNVETVEGLLVHGHHRMQSNAVSVVKELFRRKMRIDDH